ncbi:MAG: ribosome silencing factor [Chloroherpetonaceae bacterium]|nr:ribosome silencing factor [Chloroherpetonaceae bacterium]
MRPEDSMDVPVDGPEGESLSTVGGDIAPDDTELSSEEKLQIVALAADSLRATDIVAIDLRGLTIIADFFLICTGNSSIQIRAIADRIEERMRERGLHKLRMEGYQEATWVLLDFGDVVAHVMAAEQRAFYDLEGFWSAAPRFPLHLPAEPPLPVRGS